MGDKSGRTVILTSSDDKQIEVPVEVASLSVTLKHMIEDLGEDQIKVPIPLPNVSGKILEKLIEYCQYYYDNKISADYKKDDITDWERSYCEIDQSFLFELILAANFLDVKPLLEVTCKTVANMMKGKNPEEIRKTFNIKNDFTPEEEEQVRRENDWCEER